MGPTPSPNVMTLAALQHTKYVLAGLLSRYSFFFVSNASRITLGFVQKRKNATAIPFSLLAISQPGYCRRRVFERVLFTREKWKRERETERAR